MSSSRPRRSDEGLGSVGGAIGAVMASVDRSQSQTRTQTPPPPRILPRNFSYNTFTPPPSTPTLNPIEGSSHDPWSRNSAAPSRTRTPDLSLSGIGETSNETVNGNGNGNGNRLEGYPIVDAVDPSREEETLGLMKNEDRGGSSSRDDGSGGGRGRWSDEFSENGDLLSPGDSEDGASMMSAGVSRVKAAQAVWGRKSQWFLFFGIACAAYIYSLDGTTTYFYLNYATSAVLQHSVAGTITTIQAIIIAVGKPLMAKLADVFGRGETFITVAVLYVIGYLVIASASDVLQIAIGQIIYSFGYTGLQMLQQIVIADMTNLQWRGLVTGLISAPFIINNFVAAEIAQAVLPNWRWGYAMFALLVPIALTPIIVALMWAQHQARRYDRYVRHAEDDSRTWTNACKEALVEIDFFGLLLIAVSLGLILLPLGLAPKSAQGWESPSMQGMIVVGILLIPVFIYYEAKIPSKPVFPMRWLSRAPILGASLIGFCDFVSFYLQNTFLYSYVVVTESWNYRGLTYFAATHSISITVFGIVAGIIMWGTKRFKYMLMIGLLIRLLGVILMLHARSDQGSVYSLVLCQILQGMGGGFAAISTQVSAQAAVAHVDVATVTAMVLLFAEVGNSVGSAVATGIWAEYMPKELAIHVPTNNQTLLNELYGSITDIATYPVNDPIRMGAITAYQAVMYKLVVCAIVVAVLPPIICMVLTKDVRLTRSQNARDRRESSSASRMDDGEE